MFVFNDTATTESYTLALRDALPSYRELYTFGPSYVGFVQWALAADAGPDLKAMATIVTAADFRASTYAGGAFSLDSVDRKSTRLNSSHANISYAVFCFKKKISTSFS